MFTYIDLFAFVCKKQQQQQHVYYNGTFLFGLVQVGAFWLVSPSVNVATAVSSTQTT